jgi:hypothetical protein
MRRLSGLLMLNALGNHGFDGLTVIEFNKHRNTVLFLSAQCILSPALPV